MTMTSIAETLDRIAGDRFQQLTDDDKIDVEDVLTAAEEYVAGRMPIHEFAKIGYMDSLSSGRVCSSYTRFVALISTPKSDPRRDALRKAINAVLVFEGFVVTTAGVWSAEDLAMHPMIVHRAKDVDPWSDQAA